MNSPFQGEKLMITQNHSIIIVLGSVFFQFIGNTAAWINMHERKRKDGREKRRKGGGRQAKLK